MLKKDKTKPFMLTPPTGPTAEDMLKNCAVNKLKADRTPIPDNRFTLPPEYGVAGGAPKIIDGYEYVDLGLPSGILWAKMNVGAESETDPGLYFQWADTQGYTASQVGTGDGQKAFGWSDYKYGPDSANLTKYNTTDNLTLLESEDDAVKVNWGGDWVLPANQTFNELLNPDYVTSEWVDNYNNSGVQGYLFTSVSNGNTLFIPAAGRYEDGALVDPSYVRVWTSKRNPKTYQNAYCLTATENNTKSTGNAYRCCGLPIRAIHYPLEDDTPSPGQPTT